nr:MAG TPA: Transition state regulatory protein abrB HOMODIMER BIOINFORMATICS [Caudoviricetes sp.]
MFGKVGGNASRNSYTCRISLPKTWVDRMGLNPERREVQIAFDGDRITIQQPGISFYLPFSVAAGSGLFFVLLFPNLIINGI